mmetsp:Transcript_2964/g.6229  ORF Transcript_2964/g.6229 Transcript_2964/m.6229 type:complete len:89 (+) Transcript_2964:1031-1297(+)
MDSQRDESVTSVLQDFSSRRSALEQSYWKRMTRTVEKFEALMKKIVEESEAIELDCESMTEHTKQLMRHADKFYSSLNKCFGRPESRC